MTNEELFEKLTEEQKEKYKACKSEEELQKLLEEEGIELDPEQLEKIAGGGMRCRHCFNAPDTEQRTVEPTLDQLKDLFHQMAECGEKTAQNSVRWKVSGSCANGDTMSLHISVYGRAVLAVYGIRSRY